MPFHDSNVWKEMSPFFTSMLPFFLNRERERSYYSKKNKTNNKFIKLLLNGQVPTLNVIKKNQNKS